MFALDSSGGWGSMGRRGNGRGGALSVIVIAVVLLVSGCSGGSQDDGEEGAASDRRPRDRTTLSTADPDPPTTTSTTAVTEPTAPSVVADAAGVGGVAVAAPAGDLVERLTAALGPPTRDTGFVTSDCVPDSQRRWVQWSDFGVVLDQYAGAGSQLRGWFVSSQEDDVRRLPDPLEVRADVALGMTWAELASRGAAWDYAWWTLGSFQGTLGNDIVVGGGQSPPGDSVVTSVGTGYASVPPDC